MNSMIWNTPMIGKFSFINLFLLVTSLLLLGSMFFTWISFYFDGYFVGLTGLSLIFKYNALSFLFYIFIAGILLFFASIIAVYNKEFIQLKFVKYTILVLYIIALVVLFLTPLYMEGVLNNNFGNISVMNNLGVGWYAAISGSAIGLVTQTLYIFY
ncbi:MAG: hypothetical protein ACP5RS_03590 [Thermoplasmata archaeon]